MTTTTTTPAASTTGMQPGDRDPWTGTVPCLRRDPDSRPAPDDDLSEWVCLAPRGHDGQHVTTDGELVLHVWAGDEKGVGAADTPPTTEGSASRADDSSRGREEGSRGREGGPRSAGTLDEVRPAYTTGEKVTDCRPWCVATYAGHLTEDEHRDDWLCMSSEHRVHGFSGGGPVTYGEVSVSIGQHADDTEPTIRLSIDDRPGIVLPTEQARALAARLVRMVDRAERTQP